MIGYSAYHFIRSITVLIIDDALTDNKINAFTMCIRFVYLVNSTTQ